MEGYYKPTRLLDRPAPSAGDLTALAQRIKDWGRELGFQQVGIATIDLAEDEARLLAWLDQGRQGEMDYMARHGVKRARPAELVPGTLRVVSARMDYLPEVQSRIRERLADPASAFVSRYALGRDYHRILRNRLQHLAERIAAEIGPFGHRAFVDSAPVLEKALAQKAGLGWIGKHTNLINTRAGSWFFLGELFVDLPLPPDRPAENHCGRCRACLDACPTGAILAPYELDARLCISYLTIELKGPIPEPLRPLIGNRVYGCDDCLLACPWNRFARLWRRRQRGPGDGTNRPGYCPDAPSRGSPWSEGAGFRAGDYGYRVRSCLGTPGSSCSALVGGVDGGLSVVRRMQASVIVAITRWPHPKTPCLECKNAARCVESIAEWGR